MNPQPIYLPHNLHPAYHLRYSWTGWPSDGVFPKPPNDQFLKDLAPDWERDGLRLLEHLWTDEMIQLSFSTKPDVSPVLVATRAKGRLDYALRTADHPCHFSRKVAIRSVGDNTTPIVEQYIENQVAKSSYIDPRFKDFLDQFTRVDDSVDLSQPTATLSGRYWYNLHLVLVVVERRPIVDEKSLAVIRDRSFQIAARKEYGLRVLSVRPDHVHMALRGNVEQSPQEIALAFQNNLAFALGQNAVWSHNYYVGTFGEYNMNAIRLRARESASPAGQAGGGRIGGASAG